MTSLFWQLKPRLTVSPILIREGSSDVKIEVGLYVLFKKSTMLKNQIKSGTISETKNVHMRLFNAVKKACTEPGVTPSSEPEEEEELETVEAENETQEGGLFALPKQGGLRSPLVAVCLLTTLLVGRYMLPHVFGPAGQSDVGHLEMQISQLQEEVRTLQKSVDLIVSLLKENTQ
jgi:hypothetical protein